MSTLDISLTEVIVTVTPVTVASMENEEVVNVLISKELVSYSETGFVMNPKENEISVLAAYSESTNPLRIVISLSSTRILASVSKPDILIKEFRVLVGLLMLHSEGSLMLIFPFFRTI